MDILRVVESPRRDGPTILPLRGFSSGRRAPRMREYLEIAASTGVELRPLDGDRVTIGRHAGNDIVLAADDSASRLHAVLERLGPGWWLRDLGSMIEERQSTRRLALLVFTISAASNLAQYLVSGPRFGGMSGVVYGLLGYIWIRGKFDPSSGLFLHPTTVQMMLIWFVLCRPVFSGDVLGVPASTRGIAAELVVTEDAVKQHLLRLYDKFGLPPTGSGNRRVELAREAVLRGAVSRADIETGGGRSAPR